MRRGDRRVGSDMLGYEIGVGPEAVAGAFDLDDDGVMQQAIEQCRCDHGVAEDVTPFGEAAVAGQDHGTLFVLLQIVNHDNISQRNHPTLPDVLPENERADFGRRRHRGKRRLPIRDCRTAAACRRLLCCSKVLGHRTGIRLVRSQPPTSQRFRATDRNLDRHGRRRHHPDLRKEDGKRMKFNNNFPDGL